MAGLMDGSANVSLRSMSSIVDEVAPYGVAPGDSLRHVIESINANAEGVALVIDDGGQLLGVITDGDVRRALLRGGELDRPISEVLAYKTEAALTAPETASLAQVLDIMEGARIRHVPILADDGQVIGLALQSRIVRRESIPLQAVIMAGGLGTRLRPLTESVPKPMLPVAGRPLMEHIIASLSDVGIRTVNVTTHYLPEKITDYFGDGSRFGVDMQYAQEDTPLGTAGALRLLGDRGETPILVINGDILTRVDFREMLTFHQHNKAAFTVGVHGYESQVPYGVLDLDGSRVVGLREKPRQSMFINAGVYLIEPRVIDLIPPDRRFDMTDLIDLLIAGGEVVAGFPIHEFWSDIGRLEDYFKAQSAVKGPPPHDA